MTVFYDNDHISRYKLVRGLMGGSERDPYRAAVAYLISLDEVLYTHRDSVFDFDKCVILPEGLHKPWQTSTSQKTTRLASNLWCGFRYEDESMALSPYYTPEHIFACEYAPYYWQAIKLRFELD